MEAFVPTPARTIVVGVDGSSSSEAALRWAALEAALTGADLDIVHAWSISASSWAATLAAVRDEEVDDERGAERLLERCRRTARRLTGPAGTSITVRQVEGGPARVLLDASRGAALLVVGQGGRGAVARSVLGSVASACAHHTSIPIVVVGTRAPDPGSADLVVGIDTSTGSRRALRWAMEEAYRTGVGVRAVHAWRVPARPPAVPVGGPAGDPLAPGTSLGELEDLVAAARRSHQAAVPVAVVGQVGPAPALLASEAADASMLVVGSRGRGGFLGLLLGSVGRHCLAHGADGRAVVIVPDRSAEVDP